MSKFCEICEKVTVAGRRIQHHHAKGWRFKAPKTKRVFKPNLRDVALSIDGQTIKATVCMKCYKKLRAVEEAHVHAETASIEASEAKAEAKKVAKAKTVASAKPKKVAAKKVVETK
jgi:ribosomal protein L28